MARKWVYLFDELDQVQRKLGGDWEKVRAFLGGKGANLAEMTRIGLPVPPGYTVTTEACLKYLKEGPGFLEEVMVEEREALKEVERKTGKKFGDPKNPLLVSCRSGAKFSMPGMMDTVLNIGLNDETAKGMIELTGDERFVYDAYRRLVHMFGTVVLGLADEPFEEALDELKRRRGAKVDTDLTAEDW
ncbi:MAG TPA: PEP/pyruvate-binding domain-containing protein, partial [Acidobacteriota bacterium]|nr:PEP/pyruvate-binding domain-containing protein [Acidobacteriota bacterium]